MYVHTSKGTYITYIMHTRVRTLYFKMFVIMIRIPEDDFSEDNKASSQLEMNHQKDTSGKSHYHIPISPEYCPETVKNMCFQKDAIPNNTSYASHIVKSSSPASSAEESAFNPEFRNQIQVTQGQHNYTMTPSGDINFYSFHDLISDPEKTILSDAEKLLRSKESDMYSNEYNHIHDVFAIRKYYHPLFAHGICRWPGCEMDLEDIASFVKHLNSEHALDDRSTAQARVQMQVVSQLESHLQKERDRLQAMMHHLYLSKQLLSPSKADRKDAPGNDMNFCSATTPILINNVSRSLYRSHSPSSVNLPIVNSGSLSSMKKRNHDKNTFSVTGGLPYMLERAGLDVQHEIQRNREFYKNADVRPPFTYASLIRQAIIDSPDKQLTLNEIYNWFQSTFCYFRRNAATWKFLRSALSQMWTRTDRWTWLLMHIKNIFP
ncbi:forkhead box protein P1 [Drosophila grimshawi]|uniref:forkhead box protein P1 n=1 Tax=Drosophila grimshawi TaxID=7222 RepID=UPI001C932253|nr:forkhead box protein P1 [Drosophila grimshawi]